MQRLVAVCILAMMAIVFVPWNALEENISGASQRDVRQMEISVEDGASLYASLIEKQLSWKERVLWLCRHYLESPLASSRACYDALATEYDEWSLLPGSVQDERLMFLAQILDESTRETGPSRDRLHEKKRIIQLATDCATWPVVTPDQRRIREVSTQIIQRVATAPDP